MVVRKRKREDKGFSLVGLRKRKGETMKIPQDSLCGEKIEDEKRETGENPNVELEGNEDAINPNNSDNYSVGERKRDGETPPDDDCCPICFENFTMACKTNCGHWFCAKCILQFWKYRTVLQKCKCPICSRLISKLTPEASLLILKEGEATEVLKNVQSYNHLFQCGVRGLIRKALGFPLAMKSMGRGLMDPDSFRANYYLMRSLALMLSCLYNISPFDFIPTGHLGARRLFDLCAIALVVILCLAGICHRLILRHRLRRLAAAQPWDLY